MIIKYSLGSVLLSLLIFGCSHSKQKSVDDIQLSSVFILQGNEKLNLQWWTSFKNTELSQFVEQALIANQTLQASQLRVKSAQLGVSIAQAEQLPCLNLNSNTTSDIERCGLAPMVFETSRQAQFVVPMAVSLGFGILFTTIVCLLVLPSLYVVVNRKVK